MKEILIFLLFFAFLIETSDGKIYNLKKYGKLIYQALEPSLTLLDTTYIKGNEINITYTIKYTYFLNEELNYSFIEDYPNNENDFNPTYTITSNKREILDNELKLYFAINNEKKKYLLLQNLLSPNTTVTSIVVENLKNENEEEDEDSSSTALTAIIVIGLVSVAAIITTFVLIGKYMFNKRQKEILSNYASSFVDDKSSLLPDNESNSESKDNKKEKINDINNNKEDD